MKERENKRHEKKNDSPLIKSFLCFIFNAGYSSSCFYLRSNISDYSVLPLLKRDFVYAYEEKKTIRMEERRFQKKKQMELKEKTKRKSNSFSYNYNKYKKDKHLHINTREAKSGKSPCMCVCFFFSFVSI